MLSRIKPLVVASLLCVQAISAISALGAAFQLEVLGARYRAVAGGSNEAYIFVRITNSDGSAKEDAKLDASPNPKGGLLLENWGFQTLLVPPVFATRAGNTELSGVLWIMAIDRFDKGVYRLKVLPAVGYHGGKKYPLPWASGEYVFRVTYHDADGQGYSLGKLTIP